MQVNLSDSEWKLMNRLWEQSPRTIMELTASLKEDTGWSKNTVITMLARLEAKGAVRHEEGGRAWPSIGCAPPKLFSDGRRRQKTEAKNSARIL